MDFDDYYLDRDDFEREKEPTICRRCGAEGLLWVGTLRGWRLFEGSKPHYCRPDPTKMFDDENA